MSEQQPRDVHGYCLCGNPLAGPQYGPGARECWTCRYEAMDDKGRDERPKGEAE